MEERGNVLRIFQETKKAVERGDATTIRNLSNQTNNTAALTNDPDNIAAAVIVYSLSKMVERADYKRLPGWGKFYETYISCIDKIIKSVEEKNDKLYEEHIKMLRKAIEKLSGKLKIYIQDVFRKASINKASKLYEHGISMERTAGLLGITLFELAEYAGSKDLPDTQQIRTVDVKARIKMAMEMFE
ncbi:MAG: hypothetical protein AABX79_00240 [Nanoarchaeota archaeon]